MQFTFGFVFNHLICCTQDWANETSNYNAMYVYAGDVEFYCRGMPTAKNGGGAASKSTPCRFSGSKANAFVYYNDFAKAAAASLKASGKQVYINFDVRLNSMEPILYEHYVQKLCQPNRHIPVLSLNYCHLRCTSPHAINCNSQKSVLIVPGPDITRRPGFCARFLPLDC